MVEIISDKDRKARKPHICDYCGETIEAGETYNHCVLKLDVLYGWSAHMICKSVATNLWDYIDPCDGMTADDFREGCGEFCRTFICPDCEQWNRCEVAFCEQDEPFCMQKIYDFLQLHDFIKVRNDRGFFVWRCVPK